MVFEEFIEDTDSLHTWRRIKRWIGGVSLGFLSIFGALGSCYHIPADSVGVVQRFGACKRQEGPGLHAKIPFFENVTEVPVSRVQTKEFGFRTLQAGPNSSFLDTDNLDNSNISKEILEDIISHAGEVPSGSYDEKKKIVKNLLRKEYLDLTGDLNMADVEFVVQYTIKDAKDYLFNVTEPGQIIRDCSSVVMKRIIGNGSVDEVLTVGRMEYEAQASAQLQEILDSYKTGIRISAVKIQSSHPPREVRDSYNAVNEAMQWKQQRINEAQKNYNEAIPKAEGDAKRIVEEAKGYAIERVNKAQGDIAAFTKLAEEYKRSPEITATRMYLETMGELLPQVSEKWIVDEKDMGLIKLLNLNDSKK